MTERLRSASTSGDPSPKMEHDLSPRKTLLVLVIVVGCFAVLWPKVFYPMLVGSANQHLKPSPIDKTTGCCDVISETDVNTIKIMSELCGTIIKGSEDSKPLTGKEIVQRCRQEVLDTCGIDISVVLQEQVRLGQSVKQILDEVRSLNGSLCLKYNYGVAPWRLGVPHRITVKTADSPNIRQERPMHLRSELVHPAFRERGRAIPQPQPAPPTRPPPRVVEGRPGPVPGMRPTIGGAGHVVPPSKQGTSSMSVIMPIYTIGIVVFFTYTLVKIIFKKQPDSVGGSLYPPIDPDPNFRKEVFESEASRLGPRLTRENISSKLVVNAMSALLDEVDQEIEARRKSSEVASQDLVNGNLSNGDAVKPQDEDQPTVKVLGMEMTASCEGGKKWSRPDSPVIPTPSPPPPAKPAPPPQEIYLEGALPAQSHLLVAESATNPEPTSGEDPAVVLSGKMTLSVISLDSENGTEEPVKGTEDIIIEKETISEKIEDDIQNVEATKEIEKNILNIQNEFEKIPVKAEEESVQATIGRNIEETAASPVEETKQKSPVAVETVQATVDTNVEEAPITVEESVSKPDDIGKSVAKLEEEEVTPNIQDATRKLIDELLKEDYFAVDSIGELPRKELLSFAGEDNPFDETETPLFKSEESIHSSGLDKDIEEFLQKLRQQDDFQAPVITLESDDAPHTLEVESLEKEVDSLIQEALESIQQKETVGETLPTVNQKTNEIIDDLKENETNEKVSETSQLQKDTQILKIDLNQEISEIEKLIQEVKDLPDVEPKLGVKAALRDNELDAKRHTIKERITPTQEQLISGKVQEPISDINVQLTEEKPNLELLKPAEASQKTDEITSSKEEGGSKDVSQIILEKEQKTEENSKVPTQESLVSIKPEEKVKTDEESRVSNEPSIEETTATNVAVVEKAEKVNIEDLAAAKPSGNIEAVEGKPKPEDSRQSSKGEENKVKPNEPIDEELGSDEELVEEIEEIVYEEESGDEEEIEIEVEVSDDEIPDERNTNRTESSSVQRVNGERSEDLVEESKYTTVSGATAAENDISDEELTDDEGVEEDEEIIEVEEIEDEDYVNEGGNDVNHVSGDSEPEL